jgi:hypothetical protein
MQPNRDGMRPDPAAIPRRPLWISDAMILIAALFVALTWDRGRLLDPMRQISSPMPKALTWRLALAAADVIELLPPLLAVASLTVLGLRLRRPRPPGRQLLRQPGTVACAVSSLFLIPAALAVLASHLRPGRSMAVAWTRTVQDLSPEYFTGAATAIGLAVSVSWLVMVASHCWRPEPGWIDRLGRLLGAGWIGMIPGGLYVALIRFQWW